MKALEDPKPEGLEDSEPAHRAHAEQAALHHVTERLTASFPAADHDTVDALVRTAHETLRHAKVRTYVPILVERRARNVLAATVTNAKPPKSSKAPQQAATDPT
ncbi:three-helix bundle dimerization domain-containing protein [Streptomyces sp. NPDC002206]